MGFVIAMAGFGGLSACGMIEICSILGLSDLLAGSLSIGVVTLLAVMVSYFRYR